MGKNYRKFLYTYRKRLKLNERKVSRPTGFHPLGKCMENFCGFCFIGTEKAIAQLKIHQENFCGLSKFAKTAKLFSRLTFVVYTNMANTARTYLQRG